LLTVDENRPNALYHGIHQSSFSTTELHAFSKGPFSYIFTRPLTLTLSISLRTMRLYEKIVIIFHELTSKGYQFFIAFFQKFVAILSGFTAILLELDRTYWQFNLTFYAIVILIFYKLKNNSKLNSERPCVQLDELYQKSCKYGGLALFITFMFVFTAYEHSNKTQYLTRFFIFILITYVFLLMDKVILFFLVSKWKRTTSELLKTSPLMALEEHQNFARKYIWKNGEAKKTYLLFMEKISPLQK
jgi:hypothetical protein